jgi:hypothetical protein
LSVISYWRVRHRAILIAEAITTTCSARIPPNDNLVGDETYDKINCCSYRHINLSPDAYLLRSIWCEVAMGQITYIDCDLTIIKSNNEITYFWATCENTQCPIGIALEADSGQMKLFDAGIL